MVGTAVAVVAGVRVSQSWDEAEEWEKMDEFLFVEEKKHMEQKNTWKADVCDTCDFVLECCFATCEPSIHKLRVNGFSELVNVGQAFGLKHEVFMGNQPQY